jgi:hypothetical protein
MQATATMTVDRVIIHQIPKAAKGAKLKPPLEVSQATITLNTAIQAHFRDRLTESFKGQSFHADYNEPAPAPPDESGETTMDPSPLPSLVVQFFNSNGENFIEASQRAAEFLYVQQNATASSGMLVFIEGTIPYGSEIGRCLAIMKLEMSGALAITPTTNDVGESTFDVAVREVTLNKKAKVFKAAFFNRMINLAEYRCLVSDHQKDASKYGSEIAEFFIRFLGCKLVDSAERSTKDFLEKVEAFAETMVDEEKRMEFMFQATAELRRASEVINVEHFAAETLTAVDADEFVKSFQLADGTVQIISKDTKLINPRLGKTLAEFEGGLKLVGSEEAIQTKLSKDDDGRWVIDASLKYIGPTGSR